jgi:hypothetical protein
MYAYSRDAQAKFMAVEGLAFYFFYFAHQMRAKKPKDDYARLI